MKNIFLLILFIVLTTSMQLNAQSSEWVLDKSHSTVQFNVSHLVISETTGLFKNFESTITTNNENFENATIEFSLMVESIDTDDAQRDKHLLSEDFFNAKQYPTIDFTSTSFKKSNDGNYKLIGNLTIKDITRIEEFNVTYGGTVKDPAGNIKAGFKLTGKINRFDYGLKWNTLLETGGAVVGEEVKIQCNIELNKNQ